MQTRIAKMGAAVAAVASGLIVAGTEAVATKGSTTIGTDTSSPARTPNNGGIAKVKSSMGNCG